jgi:hypothetical protein
MKPNRTGLNRCSTAILPRGSHQSSASAEKRSTSAVSTVDPRLVLVLLAMDLLQRARLRRPDLAAMYTRLFGWALADLRFSPAIPPEKPANPPWPVS